MTADAVLGTIPGLLATAVVTDTALRVTRRMPYQRIHKMPVKRFTGHKIQSIKALKRWW